MEPVEGATGTCRDGLVIVALLNDVGCQLVGNGNFALGSLAQRYAECVANTVSKEGANACRTLDSAIFALACLSHAEVKGEGHLLLTHYGAKQAHAAHHHYRIAGLNGDYDVLEILLHANAQEFHATLYDALGGIAVTAHNTVGKRPMVYAYAKRRSVFATNIKQTREALFEALEFGCIFLVRIFQRLERTSGIYVITRVDAHLLYHRCGNICHIGVEVYVCHERICESRLVECLADGFKSACLNRTLGSETHIIASRLNDCATLRNATLCVGRGSGGHTLNTDGVATAKRTVANHYFMRFARCVIEEFRTAMEVAHSE